MKTNPEISLMDVPGRSVSPVHSLKWRKPITFTSIFAQSAAFLFEFASKLSKLYQLLGS